MTLTLENRHGREYCWIKLGTYIYRHTSMNQIYHVVSKTWAPPTPNANANARGSHPGKLKMVNSSNWPDSCPYGGKGQLYSLNCSSICRQQHLTKPPIQFSKHLSHKVRPPLGIYQSLQQFSEHELQAWMINSWSYKISKAGSNISQTPCIRRSIWW